MSFIDLHVHTTASDGTLSPKEVVELAANNDISVIAITDHDSVNGIKEAKDAARESKTEVVPGVEISCGYEGREIHVLGFFIDWNDQIFQERLHESKGGRDQRNDKMIALMRQDGIDISMEKLKFGKEDTVVNRAHFARFLKENGYVKSNEEAFKKYVGDGCKYYLEREYVPAETAIEWIHEAGGIAFLAHPYLYHLKEPQVKKLVKDFKEMGGDGLEAYHSSVNQGQVNLLREYAKENNLMVSGGTDFHGANKPYIHLGVGKGNMRLTEHIYKKIKLRQV